MRRSDNRGRQACILSEYHQRLHNEAIERAAEYAAMKAAGMSNKQIAAKVGKSEAAVADFFHRMKRRMR